MIPFTRRGTVITAHLHALESDILRSLCEQLVDLLRDRAQPDLDEDSLHTAGLLAQLGIGGSSTLPTDPALARLLPNAYRGDAAAASEHRRLTELGVVERKIVSAQRLAASLRSTPVDLDEIVAISWLRTLADLRLTLAARLHIEHDGDDGSGDPAMLELYDWLGYLQSMLLEIVEQTGAIDAQ